MTDELRKSAETLSVDNPERVTEITQLHNEVTQALRTSLAKAIRIGELLTEQKASLPHGAWGAWIDEHLPFSRRTATNYMRLFDHRDELKSEKFSDLSSAYRMIRSATTDDHDADPLDEDAEFVVDLETEYRSKPTQAKRKRKELTPLAKSIERNKLRFELEQKMHYLMASITEVRLLMSMVNWVDPKLCCELYKSLVGLIQRLPWRPPSNGRVRKTKQFVNHGRGPHNAA
jgi:hypothetical protein